MNIKPMRVGALIRAGGQMSNICFNLGQDTVDLSTTTPDNLKRYQKSMRQALAEWEKALEAYNKEI